MHAVAFRIDPLRTLLEHRREQALLAATRERTDDDELPPETVGRQNSERSSNRRHRRESTPFEIVRELRIGHGAWPLARARTHARTHGRAQTSLYPATRRFSKF